MNTHQIDLRTPITPPLSGHLRIGGSDPQGNTIGANSRYLTRNGQPYLPVMGEFHFSRCPGTNWEDEILKMKAGGIQLVATYVFWIHHEEIQGEFDFGGQRDLRRFVALCQKHGLYAFVRIGPWAHGECRNGGFPDWLLPLCKTRSDDPVYLQKVRLWWTQIHAQLDGLYFHEGGPIIGIQLENELYWNAPHLQTLKNLAQELGILAPLYTATGWGSVHIPEDEILPVYGGYPDGFWERSITGWPGHYRIHYFFNHRRNDDSIGNDLNPTRVVGDNIDPTRYPYVTCEMGGGMQTSYHRRPRVPAADIAALSLVKLGSGGNLLGYYMYHGGVNPQGKTTTLQESQATGYPNDLQILNYDFQAALGSFGQTRDSYRSLRLLHHFVGDFGSLLAPMVSVLPEVGPTGLDDTDSLRWAVRTDDASGFVFVNNHQRIEPLPAKEGVQVTLQFPDETVLVPEQPIMVPGSAYFIWPVNLMLQSVRLKYATVQLLCRIQDGDTTCFVFFASGEIAPEFVFDLATTRDNRFRVTDLTPGTDCVLDIQGIDGETVRLLLLTEAQALHCGKGQLWGAERLVLSDADLLFDTEQLRLRTTAHNEVSFAVYPAPPYPLTVEGETLTPHQDGVFTTFTVRVAPVKAEITWEKIRDAAPVSPVSLGPAGVATVPAEEAFAQAALWRLSVPDDALDGVNELLLRIAYVGDVARLYCGDRLLLDDFYNGLAWEVGLKRFADEIRSGKELTLAILPLRQDAPIYLSPESWPDFPSSGEVAELLTIETAPYREAQVLHIGPTPKQP